MSHKFGSDQKDYEDLRVEGDDLFWKGKKLRTVHWTRGEKIAAIGIVVAAVVSLFSAGLNNWDKWKPQICGVHEFWFCRDVASPLQPPAKKQQ